MKWESHILFLFCDICGSSTWHWHASSSDVTSFSASFCFGWGYFNLIFLWAVFQLICEIPQIFLFSEYPLLFSMAIPADNHLAGHPNGHTHTHSNWHTQTQVCTHMHVQLLHPRPRELQPLQLFSGLSNKTAAELLMSVLWSEPALIMLLPRKNLSHLDQRGSWTM